MVSAFFMMFVTHRREIVWACAGIQLAVESGLRQFPYMLRLPAKGMEVFMRKGYRICLILLILAAMAGCSGGPGSETMDFQAEREWKAPEPAVGTRPRILFVGNSHTFYNNLPGTFINIVQTMGHKSEVFELAQDYYSLEKFADTENEVGALLDKTVVGKKWDFVVLQENSSVAMSDSAEENMYPYARVLDEKVKSSGGQTAFLMTWAPRDGIKEGFKKQSLEQLQSVMAENYMAISDELNGLLIPAGISFMRCMKQYPDIELWAPDGYHPSPAGTYLAACTIYATVYQESPETCNYFGELEMEEAHKLQKIAAELVLGGSKKTSARAGSMDETEL